MLAQSTTDKLHRKLSTAQFARVYSSPVLNAGGASDAGEYSLERWSLHILPKIEIGSTR